MAVTLEQRQQRRWAAALMLALASASGAEAQEDAEPTVRFEPGKGLDALSADERIRSTNRVVDDGERLGASTTARGA